MEKSTVLEPFSLKKKWEDVSSKAGKRENADAVREGSRVEFTSDSFMLRGRVKQSTDVTTLGLRITCTDY